MNITLPTIHMNGTCPDQLRDDNLKARTAIEDAIDTIAKMEFNSRDYYPVSGSWEKAKSERLEHVHNLRAASEYFLAIAKHAQNKLNEREARRRS